MKPALTSDMQVRFSSGNDGTQDPLNQYWEPSVSLRDAQYRLHTYKIRGNDLIVLPSVEALAPAILKLLMEGVKD